MKKGIKIQNSAILLMVVLILLIQVGCSNRDFQIKDINLEIWNKTTLNGIKEYCNIEKNDYNKRNNPPLDFVFIGNQKFYTIEDQILFLLKDRKYLYEYISNLINKKKIKRLALFEMYKINSTLYVIKIDNQELLSLCVEQHKIVKIECISKSGINDYEDFFSQNNREFINTIDDQLDEFHLNSEIRIGDNGIIEYNIKEIWLSSISDFD